jgi:hypothetical protein
MNIRKLIKSLLFIFVAFSLAFFVYKEFSPKNESNAPDISAKNVDTPTAVDKSALADERRSLKESETKQQNPVTSSKTAVKAGNAKVIAYYFHGTFRCTTCRTIEKYSKEAIETYFASELKNGTLDFKPINVDEPENRHYIQDYQLYTRSLVLALYKDDKQLKWKNLSEVWSYVSDKEKFYQYVKDESERFLQETE